MKCIILAAGYATRLYPLTKELAKPLLTVGSKTIVEHLLDKIDTIEEVTDIFIVTNEKFFTQFNERSTQFTYSKKIKIINDGTLTNEDRLGSIGDTFYVIEQENIDDDLLVIAGDNFFDYSLKEFIQFSKKQNSSTVAVHDLKDINKVRHKFGVVLLNETKITHFEEKPAQPKSSFAATACYFFKQNDLQRISELVKLGNIDCPGEMIKYLVEKSHAHAFVFTERWFDIGSFENLNKAREYYETKRI